MSRRKKTLHRRRPPGRQIDGIDILATNLESVERRAAARPDLAEEVRKLSKADIEAIATGIAWSHHFGYPDNEVQANAGVIIDWSILTEELFGLGIGVPLPTLMPDELIEILQRSAREGHIPLPSDELYG